MGETKKETSAISEYRINVNNYLKIRNRLRILSIRKYDSFSGSEIWILNEYGNYVEMDMDSIWILYGY